MSTPSGTLQTTDTSQAIVIIGAGLAGLFTALQLAPLPTIVIAAKALGAGTSSLWAQGGIAAAVGQGDTPQAHAQDTIIAGASLVNEGIALSVAQEAPERIRDLLEYGVPFDKDLAGKLDLGLEAAHSANRIVHVQGDRAGAAIMQALITAVKQTPSIQVLEQVEVHKLEAKEGQMTAVYLWPSQAKGYGPGEHLQTSNVILATGGVGHLYSQTTNPEMSRGEGIAMAARIGAQIRDPEFVQFHPTAINSTKDPAPLVTEALRGKRAKLVDKQGKRFMPPIHEKGELAPRDIVARAVFNQNKKEGAFLDCTHLTDLAKRFPTVFENCTATSIDPTKQPIPVATAAHFHMGGVKTDETGQSTIKGLWACGEVASTGLHGANRLASNSLLEAVVFAKRIAKTIKAQQGAPTPPDQIDLTNITFAKVEPIDLRDDVMTLRRLMSEHVGVERNEKGLKHALNKLEQLAPKLNQSERYKNMLITAKFITYAALKRVESRGSHYRTDAPSTNDKAGHTTLHLNDIARQES